MRTCSDASTEIACHIMSSVTGTMTAVMAPTNPTAVSLYLFIYTCFRA